MASAAIKLNVIGMCDVQIIVVHVVKGIIKLSYSSFYINFQDKWKLLPAFLKVRYIAVNSKIACPDGCDE